ncbi:MAG: hypothetical protein JXR69_03235 [Candidatus Delongbacteria bacterium]|nr:hypothetical protein [Candidatus Delongbacteria bacterium]
MRILVTIMMLINVVLVFSGINTRYHDLYLINSTYMMNNVLQYEGMSEFNSEILGIDYNSCYDFNGIVDVNLDSKISFNRNFIDGFYEYDYNQIYTEGVTTLIGYEFDQFYSTRQEYYLNFGVNRFMTDYVFAGVSFPLHFKSFNLQKVENKDSYSKAKFDYQISGGFDNRISGIHLFSPWNKFERGFLLSFSYGKGISYEAFRQVLDPEELPVYMNFKLSRSFLINKFDAMLKLRINFQTQSNEDYNFIYSDHDFTYYKWTGFNIFYAHDYSAKINWNTEIGLKIGEFRKYNDSKNNSASVLNWNLEANYYLSSKIRIYGQFGIEKYLSVDSIPENKYNFDPAITSFKFGVDVYIDIKNL